MVTGGGVPVLHEESLSDEQPLVIDGEAERRWSCFLAPSVEWTDATYTEKGAESWKQGGAVGSNSNMAAVDTCRAF